MGKRVRCAGKFGPRVFVIGDRRQILHFDPGMIKAISDRMLRETGIVPPSRKPLFLYGADDFAIAQKGRSTVMIKTGQT
jgi:hypothetical protein